MQQAANRLLSLLVRLARCVRRRLCVCTDSTTYWGISMRSISCGSRMASSELSIFLVFTTMRFMQVGGHSYIG
ncbi:hypothetical protein HDV64DRAFT_255028 [Trichoderma sp. TUCIM 5745]